MKKTLRIITLTSLLLLSSCYGETITSTTTPAIYNPDVGNTAYQILVYSFDDSDGDAMGDIPGITNRLDYLKDMGITLIWLSPIHPSSTYHGYNVLDYYGINEQYGTMDDFKELLAEAHQRGISVILDMVLNHTDSSHPWFIDACKNENDKRDYYVWKDDSISYGTTSSYSGKFYSNPTCGAPYFSSFTSSMPDLNLNNPKVVEEQKNILKFWLDLGVDGFRYDAIKHFFDVSEYASNYDRIAAIDSYLANINGFVEDYKKNAFIVGEYLDFDVFYLLPYAPYFDSEFEFGWYDRILSVIRSSNTNQYAEDFMARYDAFKAENANWVNTAIIGNHDHDRIMSILGSTKRAKLALSLQMLLPGMPFVYSGDEVGIKGARYNNNDIERRLPMNWGDSWYHVDPSQYGAGMYRAGLNDDVASVKIQLEDERSLLNYYKSIIQFRNSQPAIHHGQLTNYPTDNSSFAAYTMSSEEETFLVIHNSYGGEQSMTYDGNLSDIIFNSSSARVENGKLILTDYASVVLKMN